MSTQGWILSQEDREEAIKKSTFVDKLFLLNLHSKANAITVLVPLHPSTPGGCERWVTAGTYGISGDIRQPNPNRDVVCTHMICGCIPTYWYGHEVLPCFFITIALAVIFTFIFTPLSLLCLIPAVIQLIKVRPPQVFPFL